VYDGRAGQGSPAQQAAWNGSNNGRGTITHRGEGMCTIVNQATGLLLDGGGNVSSGSTAAMPSSGMGASIYVPGMLTRRRWGHPWVPAPLPDEGPGATGVHGRGEIRLVQEDGDPRGVAASPDRRKPM
jgi:hypothetical protein